MLIKIEILSKIELEIGASHMCVTLIANVLIKMRFCLWHMCHVNWIHERYLRLTYEISKKSFIFGQFPGVVFPSIGLTTFGYLNDRSFAAVLDLVFLHDQTRRRAVLPVISFSCTERVRQWRTEENCHDASTIKVVNVPRGTRYTRSIGYTNEWVTSALVICTNQSSSLHGH